MIRLFDESLPKLSIRPQPAPLRFGLGAGSLRFVLKTNDQMGNEDEEGPWAKTGRRRAYRDDAKELILLALWRN